MASEQRPLLLGVDVGTTAVKAGVFDLDGRMLAGSAIDYPTAHPRRDWSEQDPEDWWRSLVEIISRIGADVDLGRVASVGVCSQVNTHVPVDAGMDFLGPGVVWQDQRCAEIAAEIDRAISDEERGRLWGGPFRVDASFSLSRAAWLARYEPEVWDRTRWLMLPKDYVNLKLTQRAATDQMSPIGIVGAAGNYLSDVLDLVPGSARRQPDLAPFTAPLGPVVAAELPALAGAVVAVGTMDAWGSILGSGLVDHGTAMEVAGTSEIVAVASRDSDPRSGVISFPPFEGLVVHAGPTQAGGDALRWWLGVVGGDIEQVVGAAEQAPPGAAGVLFHPYLAGERAPLWNARARASFVGVGAEHDHRHFARAVLEGVACSARHVLETAEAAGEVSVDAVNASGGGNRSDLWCQIKADVFGRRLDRLRVRDTGVLGAALMGAVAAGLFDDLPTAARRTVEVERAFDPDPAQRDRHRDLYRLYQQVGEAGESVYDALSAWREAYASPTA